MKAVHAIFASLGFLATTAAYAGPPVDQWAVFREAKLSCVQKEDLKKLVSTQQTEGKSTYLRLFNQYNQEKIGKFYRCSVSNFWGVQVGGREGDVEDMGFLQVEGKTNHGWILHVGTSDYEGYLLYLEADTSI